MILLRQDSFIVNLKKLIALLAFQQIHVCRKMKLKDLIFELNYRPRYRLAPHLGESNFWLPK